MLHLNCNTSERLDEMLLYSAELLSPSEIGGNAGSYRVEFSHCIGATIDLVTSEKLALWSINSVPRFLEVFYVTRICFWHLLKSFWPSAEACCWTPKKGLNMAFSVSLVYPNFKLQSNLLVKLLILFIYLF